MNILQAENSVNGRCHKVTMTTATNKVHVSVHVGETAAVGGADMWLTGRGRRGPGSPCSSTNQRPIWQRSSGRGPLSCFFLNNIGSIVVFKKKMEEEGLKAK